MKKVSTLQIFPVAVQLRMAIIKPDLWGPGVAIKTTRREGGYTSVNGTSFSTPFVSGTVALMLDANPNLTPSKIKSILVATAFRWFPGGKSNEGGFGRLQSYQAVTRAASITSNLQPPEVPSYRSFRSFIDQGKGTICRYSYPKHKLPNCNHLHNPQ